MAKACQNIYLVLLFLSYFSAASNIFRNDFHPINELNAGESNSTSFVQPRNVNVTTQDDHTNPSVNVKPRAALLSITSVSNCNQDIYTYYSGKDIYTDSRRRNWCSYVFSNPEGRLIEITCSTTKKNWCGWWIVNYFYHAFQIDGQRYYEDKTETFQISTTSSNFDFSFYHATSCFRLNCVFSPPAVASTTTGTTTATTSTTTVTTTTTAATSKATTTSATTIKASTTSATTTTATTSKATTTTATTTTVTPTAAPKDCQCGKVNRASRIVNGVETEQNEYPFQTLVLMTNSRGTFQCGGSIIYQEWILTAAHCTDGFSASQVKVAVGIHDVNIIPNYHQVVSVYNHENYNSITVENDIALLKLQTPLTFSDTISPICLPKSSSENYDGLTPTVIGWGTTSSDGPLSDVLLEVDVPVVSNSDCSIKYSTSISSAKLCAGVEGKDSCQGDSGGPLFTDKLQTPCLQQIGIVSYGRGCAERDYPGVYARVSNFLQWISSKTGK